MVTFILLSFPSSSSWLVWHSVPGHYIPQWAELIVEANNKNKIFNLKGIAVSILRHRSIISCIIILWKMHIWVLSISETKFAELSFVLLIRCWLSFLSGSGTILMFITVGKSKGFTFMFITVGKSKGFILNGQ